MLFFPVFFFCLATLLPSCPAAEPASAPPADSEQSPEATPDLEAEIKNRLQQQREELLAKAKHSVQSTDQAFVDSVPQSFRSIIGYRVLGIAAWRLAAGAGLFVLVIALYLYFRRRYKLRERNKAPVILGSWHLLVHVLILGLKNPAKLLVAGLLLKVFAWLILTRFHPETAWASNLLLYFSFIFYLYDLVTLIDKYYGQWLFHSPDRLLDTVRPIAVKVAKIIILVVALLHIYQSITGQTLISIVAGLGIGGLALALASQETLKNLLGFANIAFDQTFLVGDTVTIASDEGVVEHVGMRSMRLRKFDGSCAIVPNAVAISTNIQSKARQPYRRREILIHLHPNNGSEKIETALAIIKDVLANQRGKVENKPPVARFDAYEPARIRLAAYFWFDPNCQTDFYDEVDRVNREIYKRFGEAGIAFAVR